MIKNVAYYTAQWGLSGCRPLTETPTSELYSVHAPQGPAVLKLLTQAGVKDEAAAPDLLKWWDGNGAIRLYEHDDQAMLLEHAPGDDLTHLVQAGRDDEATMIIGEVLNTLHLNNTSAPPGNLTPLTRRFRSLFEKAEADKATNPASLFIRGANVARRLLAEDTPSFVLHGDMHHENVRHHSERGWLCLDPKGLYGDRTYDAANTLCNPHKMPGIVQNPQRLSRQAGILADVMGIDRECLLSYVFAHSCLSACWCLEDGQNPDHALAMAELSESFLKDAKGYSASPKLG